MEELFDNHNYPEAKKVEVATNQLKGDAKFWWSVETTRRYHYNPASSWTDMKHHMKRRYVPPNFPEHIERYYDYKKRFVHTKQDLVTNNNHAPFNLDQVSSQCLTTSITHLSLSKESETGLWIKKKLLDKTMSDKEDLTKQMEVTVQNHHSTTVDTPSSLLLIKEPALTPKVHANPSRAAQQGKCLTLYSPPGIECLCGDVDETKVRPTPHGDKEYAKERDSFVKEEQLVIQAKQMDSGGADQSISVESSYHHSHTLKLNQNQGVLYSLLIKEAAMGSFNTTCGHKGYKETLWTNQNFSNINHQITTINNTSKIKPEPMKSQGKLLNSHLYIRTNLLSCYVGEAVLRTKLCQGGGYDEDIQSTFIHGVRHKVINQAELTRMDAMHGYKAWDPGDGILIYKAEDSRFQDMKTHVESISKHSMSGTRSEKFQGVFNAFRAFTKIPSSNHLGMLSRSHIHPKESTHTSNSSLDSLYSSQSTSHQAKADNTKHLHSFSLIHGFIPQGFTGEVFNEANASHGVVPDGLEDAKPKEVKIHLFEARRADPICTASRICLNFKIQDQINHLRKWTETTQSSTSMSLLDRASSRFSVSHSKLQI